MENYYFFDSNLAIGDRRLYSAADWSKVLSKFLESGIYNEADNLAVTADGTKMAVTVGAGVAFIEGRMYENSEPLELRIDAAEASLDRIDLVVLRLDMTEQNRYIKAFVVKGTAAENPVSPVPVDNTFIKEIPLAEVRVIRAKSTIDDAEITDRRNPDFVDPFTDGSRISTLERDSATYEWVKKFGIGNSVVNITNNLDTITQGGLNSWSAASIGAPTTLGGGQLLHLPGNNVNYQTQLALRDGVNAAYYRNKNNGVWEPWRKIITDEPPTWINIPLQNGAVAVPGHLLYVTKIGPIVIIRGQLDAATAAGTNFATLFAGYRPITTLMYLTTDNSINLHLAKIGINPSTGVMTLHGKSVSAMSVWVNCAFVAG
ncbi:pyocin knob domain-containing protein [Bacillus sp. B-jedd]|uniref:pyocin knob domain-containing protein n=1 Tax=Bacillus sp. B-jedd TaxID=1476857 RepID=UPI0005156D0E|nr:pyocin knob domain-containing protein [Bacillus sp. B-jedd]CEG28075.1 phage structural protein, truncation [Bacillus sp. B-jedd]